MASRDEHFSDHVSFPLLLDSYQFIEASRRAFGLPAQGFPCHTAMGELCQDFHKGPLHILGWQHAARGYFGYYWHTGVGIVGRLLLCTL